MDSNFALGSDKTQNMIWLTDEKGNSYLVNQEVISTSYVPPEVKPEIKDLLESDTKGYGDAQYLLDGIAKLWGLKMGQSDFDSNFDLNGDGIIGSDDWDIAKKGYYEQNPSPSPSAPPPGK